MDPCPKCAGEAKLVTSPGGYFYCECQNCGFRTIQCATEELAVALWHDFCFWENFLREFSEGVE